MPAFDNFTHAVVKAACRAEHAQKLRDIAATCGYRLDHIPTRKVRGWPQPSAKPWALLYGDGTLVASFATLDQLERNVRGRCAA